jgi:hypothetical protein
MFCSLYKIRMMLMFTAKQQTQTIKISNQAEIGEILSGLSTSPPSRLTLHNANYAHYWIGVSQWKNTSFRRSPETGLPHLNGYRLA